MQQFLEKSFPMETELDDRSMDLLAYQVPSQQGHPLFHAAFKSPFLAVEAAKAILESRLSNISQHGCRTCGTTIQIWIMCLWLLFTLSHATVNARV